MAITMDVLELEIIDNSRSAVNGLDLLSSSLNKLKSATANSAGLNKISKALAGLSTSFSGLQNINVPTGKIVELTNALKPLTTLGKSSFNSLVTGLSKVGEVSKTLETVDMNKFATQIQRVAAAMRPLADEAAKVYVGLKWLPSVVNKVIGANGKLSTSNYTAAKSYNAFGISIKSATAKFGIMVLVARRMGDMIGGWIEKANMYVENLNLFNVSMGKYAQEALDYAKQINASMGVDVSEWIRNQGIIMDMSKSFGVAEETSYKMSKALTQLAYDYSSLYNIKVVESMQKVQSAIAGEIEPVRRLGKDISVAKLQTELLALGFDMSVNSMTQAEKSMLRTISLLKQSTSAMGDYARTLESPANQMRVFSARVGEMVRALGNMFIPAISAVLPYITAFVQIVTEAANAIALFFGFEFPKIDYSSIESVGSSIGGIESSLDNAASAAKKLKGMLAGFDELNVIQQQDTGAAGAGGIGNMDLSNTLATELDRLTKLYDEKFAQVIKGKTEEIAQAMRSYFEPLIPFFEGIGTILSAAWSKIKEWNDTYFYPWLVNVGKWMKQNPETLKKIGEWVAAIGLAFLGWKVISPIVSGVSGAFKILATAFGAFKAGGAIGKLFAAGGLFSKTGAIATGFSAIFGTGGIVAKMAAGVKVLLAPIGAAFTALAGALGISVGGLAAIVVGVAASVVAIIFNWDNLKVFFTQAVPAWWNGKVVPFFKNMWNGTTENISNVIDGAKSAWDGFVNWFKDLPRRFGVILGQLAAHFVNFFLVDIPNWINSAKDWLDTMVENFKTAFANSIAAVKQWGTDTWNYLSVQVPRWISSVVTWFSELPGKIWTWMVETYKQIVQWGKDTKNWIITEVPKLTNQIVDFFIQLPGKLLNIGKDMIQSLWDGIKSVWGDLSNWLSEAWKDLTSGFKEGFDSTIKVNFGKGRTQGYASGGFPASGEFFMARENGIPEMVGAIGNRTAVANNDQIVSGIASGVSKANEPVVAAIHAMTNAMINAYMNNQPIVAIGEKEIARAAQVGINRMGQIATAP